MPVMVLWLMVPVTLLIGGFCAEVALMTVGPVMELGLRLVPNTEGGLIIVVPVVVGLIMAVPVVELGFRAAFPAEELGFTKVATVVDEDGRETLMIDVAVACE